jgi:hypothetical protein
MKSLNSSNIVGGWLSDEYAMILLISTQTCKLMCVSRVAGGVREKGERREERLFTITAVIILNDELHR